MAQMTKKSLAQPEETRPFEEGMGKLEVVSIGESVIGRGTFEPGWQWSKHVKPIAGTDSCQAPHFGYVISGKMTIRMNDGEEIELGPDDIMNVPPGHDAWVIGDEPCVMIDWSGYTEYAKRRAAAENVDLRESSPQTTQ